MDADETALPHRREADAERIEQRRKLLLKVLGAGMASFAIVSLGSQAHAQPRPSPGCGTYDPNGDVIYDTDCGTSGDGGPVAPDNDCGVAVKSGGSLHAGDNDCGLASGGATMTDQDCGSQSHLITGVRVYHNDDDCPPRDLDCGKVKAQDGSTWADNS